MIYCHTFRFLKKVTFFVEYRQFSTFVKAVLKGKESNRIVYLFQSVSLTCKVNDKTLFVKHFQFALQPIFLTPCCYEKFPGAEMLQVVEVWQ